MYTKDGNAKVHKIAMEGEKKALAGKEWYNWCENALNKLAKNKKYGEATDSAVSNSVYEYISKHVSHKDLLEIQKKALSSF